MRTAAVGAAPCGKGGRAGTLLWIAHFWLLLHSLWMCPCTAVNYKKVSSVKNAMYKVMQYSRACYKLLNTTGATGCESPGQIPDTAVLIHYADLPANVEGEKVVLVPIQQFEAFMLQFLSNPVLQGVVKGVLVNPTTGRPASQSSASTFPGAAFAPYSTPSQPSSYVWNLAGSDLSRQWLGIPVYMLTSDLVADAVTRANYNQKNGYKTTGAVHVAKMDVVMAAQHNSSYCLRNGQCMPVGGYSVWSALPPIPDPSYATVPSKPITLVTAQLDSNSFFHDLTQGANVAMSGLVTMLAAATLLAQSGNAAAYERQLVFAALAGEAFDYMGSRRLLYEMSLGNSSVVGLTTDLIDQVISLDQLGRAYSKPANASTFYVHAQSGTPWGDASPLLTALQDAAAATAAAGGTGSGTVSVRAANASNPGIPPSPLASFLRVRPSLSGAVLAEYDTAYLDTWAYSEYDDGTNMTVQAMVDSTVILARALNQLAYGSLSVQPLQVDRTYVTALAANLTQCLVLDSPGLACYIGSQLITPNAEVVYGEVSYAARAYVGVLRDANPDPRDNRDKPSLQRFVWNYLANITATSGAAAAATAPLCDMTKHFCTEPLACVGWRFGDNPEKNADTMGRCRDTTTRYVGAYSTKFYFGVRDRLFGWHMVDDAAAWDARYGWPADAAWTESNWDYGIPYLKLYQLEARSVQVAIIVSGFMLTVATGVLSYLARLAFEKHLKTD